MPRSPQTNPMPARIPVRAARVEASRVGSDFVVLDGDGRMIRGLNATGARTFELCDGRHDELEIARQLAREFAVDVDRALADVRAFVDALVARRLLHVNQAVEAEGASR